MSCLTCRTNEGRWWIAVTSTGFGLFAGFGLGASISACAGTACTQAIINGGSVAGGVGLACCLSTGYSAWERRNEPDRVLRIAPPEGAHVAEIEGVARGALPLQQAHQMVPPPVESMNLERPSTPLPSPTDYPPGGAPFEINGLS